MKKILILLLSCTAVWAFGDGLQDLQEPLILLNPSRETFLNFPSASLPNKIITVFLPEPAVPLHQNYPVVYVLGAIAKDAPFAEAVLKRAQHKAILVGINTTQADLKDLRTITTFFERELMPYIETNYLTVNVPESKTIAVQGAEGVQVARALLDKHLFGRAVLWQPGEDFVSFAKHDENLRIWIGGQRGEILALQQALQETGYGYGPNYVIHLQEKENETLWDVIDLDYLFAPSEKLQVKTVKAVFSPSAVLHMSKQEAISLTWKVHLANRMIFDYIAPSLRMTPPYLHWDESSGQLTALSGALPGKVKMSAFVDKTPWKGKIKLKK